LTVVPFGRGRSSIVASFAISRTNLLALCAHSSAMTRIALKMPMLSSSFRRARTICAPGPIDSGLCRHMG
jgi:hypothetical protein